MRKILGFLCTIGLLFSFIGCSRFIPDTTQTESKATENMHLPSSTTSSESVSETQSTSNSMQEPMNAVMVPAVTEEILSESGKEIFSYTYQNISLVLQDPTVADKVIINFLGRIDEISETASEIALAAQGSFVDNDTWMPYLCSVLYTPTRIDRGVLSLYGTLTTYMGGVHPEHTNRSANYDLTTGDVLTLGSIMHPETTKQVFCELVIKQLEEISIQKTLYANYAQLVQQRFSTEESMDEDFYFSASGLCFYFAPYEIAPYSSGIINVEIPYTELTGVLNDAFFPAESELHSGAIRVTPFEKADLSQFNQIAELVLEPETDMYLIYANPPIRNLQISIEDNSSIPAGTPLAAGALTPGDAIMVQAGTELLSKLSFSYETAEGIQKSKFTDLNQ